MHPDYSTQVVGDWADVAMTCRKGHLQPQVLFYEAVSACWLWWLKWTLISIWYGSTGGSCTTNYIIWALWASHWQAHSRHMCLFSQGRETACWVKTFPWWCRLMLDPGCGFLGTKKFWVITGLSSIPIHAEKKLRSEIMVCESPKFFS